MEKLSLDPGVLTRAAVKERFEYCTRPSKRFMNEDGAYLPTKVSNPEAPDRPNKKHRGPHGWLHIGEQGITSRC
ncbi:MAG: hypothetical protein ABUL62_02325 [Myxococcales bacterium]|jgi:hypothetical protein